MPDKPKFLYRPSEWGGWFAAISRRLKANKKAGVIDEGAKSSRRVLHGLLRWRKAAMRHHKWWPVYKEAYESAFDKGLYDGLTDKQAEKRARQKAEYAVVDAFPDEVTTTRAVRDAFDEKKE